jgi:hypothetical protein
MPTLERVFNPRQSRTEHLEPALFLPPLGLGDISACYHAPIRVFYASAYLYVEAFGKGRGRVLELLALAPEVVVSHLTLVV